MQDHYIFLWFTIRPFIGVGTNRVQSEQIFLTTPLPDLKVTCMCASPRKWGVACKTSVPEPESRYEIRCVEESLGN